MISCSFFFKQVLFTLRVLSTVLVSGVESGSSAISGPEGGPLVTAVAAAHGHVANTAGRGEGGHGRQGGGRGAPKGEGAGGGGVVCGEVRGRGAGHRIAWLVHVIDGESRVLGNLRRKKL